ncbi:MAG: molybdopterin-guanine dinucleotide biosynthesis protein B [Thermoleophilia bacterium]
MRSRQPFSVAILAGGLSSRMGGNKALVLLGGRPMAGRVADSLKGLSDDVFFVGGRTADYEQFGLPHIADQYDTTASIVGVYSALAAARHQLCLVVSCDMPFAAAPLAWHLAAAAAGYDAAAPLIGVRPEPLFTVYRKSCLPWLRGRIEAGELPLRGALAGLKVRWVGTPQVSRFCDPALAFFNVNSPEELDRAHELLAAGETGAGQQGAGAVNGLSGGERSRPPLVCFVGKKNSGKTTFLERLVSLLVARGLTVAYIKHDVHGFEFDREGTDTWRLSRAGAHQVVISSPWAVAGVEEREQELSLEELHADLADACDLVIAEGFKTAAVDRIEVSRDAVSGTLACSESDLLAVVSDRPGAADTLPVFGMENVDEVARFVMERYGLAPAAGGTG